MQDSNRSPNPSLHDVSLPARRIVLGGGLGAAAASLLGPVARALAAAAAGGAAGCAAPGAGGSRLGFEGVPPSAVDRVVVPPGYTAAVLAPWGTPVGLAGPAPVWRPDASDSADDQALQTGMHHDGLHYFALDGSRRGLLCINHEYVDDGLLHPGGLHPWTAEKVRKSQAAHGVSVVEIELGADGWRLVRPSALARRITATTPIAVSGPAAGHPLLRTAADPGGRRVAGTFANCGAGKTPWGTFLTSEENFQDYFVVADTPTAHERRWGMRSSGWYGWHLHDPRFDAVRHPNEPNRFGWIVEIDPMDPGSTPVKRTALGRGAHEGAWVGVTAAGRAVVYCGEDARFEYLYKFVSRDRIRPAGGGLTAAQANANLLDQGTLYVARFDADGSGRWLPLVQGSGPLTAAAGFADAGELLVKTRQAADLLGATKMDRPEWLAIDPQTGWVYCALTGNDDRGSAGHPGADAANPRAPNPMGHIVRWLDGEGGAGDRFDWNHLLLAGDPAAAEPALRGNVVGDAFAAPDTLAFDPRGVLWIGTDVRTRLVGQGALARFGNNQLLACDPATGEVRRFLTGPVNAEITGCTWTPDGRTMFVNVQHPGEPPAERSDPAAPRRHSNWPDFLPHGRPRSATLAIRRVDGGVVGA